MSDSSSGKGERLQKLIAQAGLASRRTAEEWIRDGLVTVNGKTASLGDRAEIGKDAIKVKGKLLSAPSQKVYYLFYKPKHVIAMINEDEDGRATIKDFLPRIKERVFTVGRMDYAGEGAILLTNDGDLTQKILKSTTIVRRYQVKVDRHPTSDELARLARGGRLENTLIKPYHVRVVETYARNALIEISFEGMGATEIRKYFELKGFFPEKVARVAIGHLSAETLTPGTYKKLEPSSVMALLSQPELAKRKIEKLVGKQEAKVRAVSEEVLKKDAERKRTGKSGIIGKPAPGKGKFVPAGKKSGAAKKPGIRFQVKKKEPRN
jgi:23S rRNA pseudouridine2605 synthase